MKILVYGKDERVGEDEVLTALRTLGSLITRLRLIDVEYVSKWKVTMRLQMSEGSPKTTLGDLQGDQSEERCNYMPVFL
jgi:hypothetical protein